MPQEDRHTIFVKEIINSNFAVANDSAEILFNILKTALDNKKYLNISFKGIDVLITAFLNSAVGRLYQNHKAEEIEQFLNFIDMNELFVKTLEKVKDLSKIYYSE